MGKYISVQYNIWNILIFGALSFTQGGNRCDHWLFFMKFNVQKLLFKAFLDTMCIFWQRSALTWINFPFQFNIIFETYQSFDPHSFNPGGDRHVRPLLFCMEFNSQQLLFEQIFDIVGNIGSIQPESDSTFPFQYNIMFRDVLH